MHHSNSALALMFVLLLAMGCKGTPETTDVEAGKEGLTLEAKAEALAKDLHVTSTNEHLVYRYKDASTGAFITTVDPSTIPEGSRRNVMVMDQSLPAELFRGGTMVLVDLVGEEPEGGYPYRVVNQFTFEKTLAESAPAEVATPAADTVLLFGAEWCPHCKKARSYLKKKKIPFKWLDVDKDPKAQALLLKLGKAKGLGPGDLSSVPILAVEGELILGFDKAKLEALLAN